MLPQQALDEFLKPIAFFTFLCTETLPAMMLNILSFVGTRFYGKIELKSFLNF